MTCRALCAALARRLQGSALLHAAALVCVAALVAFTIPVRAQSALLPSVVVAPGVWAFVGPLDGPGAENHAPNATDGVIATGEGTILVDTGAPAHVVPGHGAPTTIAIGRAQTGEHLRYVVEGVKRHAKEMAGVEAAPAELGAAPSFAKLANLVQLHRPDFNRANLRAQAGE